MLIKTAMVVPEKFNYFYSIKTYEQYEQPNIIIVFQFFSNNFIRGLFPDPGPWKIPQTREVLLRDTLGIEALPRQRFNKTKRTPYVLNIMVVGKREFYNLYFNLFLILF